MIIKKRKLYLETKKNIYKMYAFIILCKLFKFYKLYNIIVMQDIISEKNETHIK